MALAFGRKIKKLAGWSVGALLVVFSVLITVTIGWRPVLGAKIRALTDRQFERTPVRLERGKYLVESVAVCFDCHSPLPQPLPPPGFAPEFKDKGAGRVFAEQGKFRVVASNITPDPATGAGTWTDDQLARAIREGIGHDGRTLFPIMPYQNYRKLSDEDLASIVVYLRSIPAVRHELPQSNIPFPLSRLINGAPEPIHEPVPDVPRNQLERGKYLVAMASCADCHTPRDNHGQPLRGMDFAGGDEFDEFGVSSVNITPDPSGIGYYDEAMFIKVMRTGHVGARGLKIPMPWWNYRNMSDDDLEAIYAYLKTVKPVRHRVDNAETASKCKLCNGKHGLGQDNTP